MARPSEFSPETANTICERIALGESLRKICAESEMPDQTTVFRWINQYDAFRQQYVHAREMQAETYADEIVEEAVKATDASLGRLAMDARKWAASKLAPKKYGDKLQNEVSGPDGGAIVIDRIVRQVVRPGDPDR